MNDIERAIEYFKHKSYEEGGTRFTAVRLAVKALEKQIPKKPTVLNIHDISNYKYGECECGEHIMDDEKYCSNCGQKLDWEA